METVATGPSGPGDTREERLALRKVRPGQDRFKDAVLGRYDQCCAVCDVSLFELIDAAHIRPWAQDGDDEDLNGLPLCPLHHRAFDAGFWAIKPGSLAVVARSHGPTLGELHTTRDSLGHLRNPPGASPLAYAWERRWRPGRREHDRWSDDWRDCGPGQKP